MTRPLLRTFGGLVMTVLVVHLIVRARTWFEGGTNAHVQVEAVVLGFFSGLLIVSLIKLIVGRIVARTRVEILTAQLPAPLEESDEGGSWWDSFLPEVQRLEDHRRTYHLIDAPEVEMYEETV